MKSSTGVYFIGLDHVRALAAFIVFTWHFIHVQNGHQAPPVFPLSLLSEGHTGVALFMTLSGYLFAKLLDGKEVKYQSFIWNRMLRLVPLLLIIILLVGVQRYLAGANINRYVLSVMSGVLLPNLPNGGWSITTEFHFYLILPLLLFLRSKWPLSLFLVLFAGITLRVLLYHQLGQIQYYSYWTVVGRIDQFLLGIIAYQYRGFVEKKHALFGLTVFVFAVFYWYFDMKGGFYMNQSYPSPSPLWIYIPTIEGAVYGLGIAWYDSSFQHSTGAVSRFVATIGTYSYSIYLFHFFFVFELANVIDRYLIQLTDVRVAVVFSFMSFLLMIPIGYLSHKYIESPFLRFRIKYTTNEK